MIVVGVVNLLDDSVRSGAEDLCSTAGLKRGCSFFASAKSFDEVCYLCMDMEVFRPVVSRPQKES